MSAAETGRFRAGAPLVLPGATLAEALGVTRPDPARIPPHLRALLPLLAAGYPRRKIAAVVRVRRSTLDPRLNRLYRLLGVHDRAGALAVAREIGLLPSGRGGQP